MRSHIQTVAFLFFVALVCMSCEIGRCLRYQMADIKDYRIFPSRTSKIGDSLFQFYQPNGIDLRMPVVLPSGNKNVPLNEFLRSKAVVAFLVIHKDSILYENYFNNNTASTPVPSFSIAKSVTSMLIGCALDDGYIRSTKDRVTDYIPELAKNGFDKVRIADLLQMTSGIGFKEKYTLVNGLASFYYGNDLRQQIGRLKLETEPGKTFEYKSTDSQILGMVLERAIYPKTITSYLEEKIWQPLGMEYDATWSMDKKRNGMEKTFCCLNARARDFAKLGRLYLEKGNWNGKQIISRNWIEECTSVDSCASAFNTYNNSWWIASHKGDFYARGMLGQYIYVNPEKQLIIVRLGEKTAGVDWLNVFSTISGRF